MTDLFTWLEGQAAYPKFYWKRGAEEWATAGNSPRQYGKAIQRPFQSSPILSKTHLPEKEGWLEILSKIDIPKVVLARKTTLIFEAPPSPFALLSQLPSSGMTQFLLQEAWDKTFFGASPEMLFSRQGRTITVDALAGTRPISAPPEELLSSEKDLHEFSLVKKSILEALTPLCFSLSFLSQDTVRPANHVQHLYNPLTGTLLPHVTDDDLLAALHPTAALGGYPRNEALAFQKEHEPFPRGHYGGPIGYSTPEEAAYAVAIRSAELNGNALSLYAGAGIVESSDPEKEWEELNQKLKQWDFLYESSLCKSPY